ncbi:MAG: hypothetical protein ACOYKZ_03920 [Chlamydiia bacterium]
MFRISWELKGRHHFRSAEDDRKSLDRSRADLEGEMVRSLQGQFEPDPRMKSDLHRAALQNVVHRAMVQYREHGLVWTNRPIPELFRQWSQVETEKSQPLPTAGLDGGLPLGAREAGPTLDVPYDLRRNLPLPDAVGVPLDEFNLDCEEHVEALRNELQWQSKNRPETLSVWVEAVLSPVVNVERKAFLAVEVLKGLLESPEVSDDHLRSALRLSETEGHLKASLSLLKQTAHCSKAPFKQLVDRVVHFVTSRVFNCCQQKVVLALVSKWLECFADWPRETRAHLSRRCSAPSISTRRSWRSLTFASSSPSTDLPLPSSSALVSRSPPLSSKSSSTQSPNPRRSPGIGLPVLQASPHRPATTEPMVIDQEAVAEPDQADQADQIGQFVSAMGLAEGDERPDLADLYEDPFQAVFAQAEEIVETLSGLYQGMTVHALPLEQKEALQNYLLTTLSDFFDFGFGSIRLLHAWLQLGDRDDQGQLRNPLGMEDLQRVVQEVLRKDQGFVGWKEVGDFQYAGNLDHLILQMEWHRHQRPHSLLLATEAALSVSRQKGGGVAFLQSLLQTLLAGDKGVCLGLGASVRSRIEVQLAAWKEPEGLPTDEGLFKELLGSIEIVVDRAVQSATNGFGLKELAEMHLQLIPLFLLSTPAEWSSEFRGQVRQHLEVVVSSLNGLLDTTDVSYLRDQLYSLLAGKTKEKSAPVPALGLHGVRQVFLIQEQDFPPDCSDELFTALFEGASALFQMAQRKYQQSAANSEGINEMTLNITTLLLIWGARHPHSLAFLAAMERFRERVAEGSGSSLSIEVDSPR